MVDNYNWIERKNKRMLEAMHGKENERKGCEFKDANFPFLSFILSSFLMLHIVFVVLSNIMNYDDLLNSMLPL